MALALKLIAPLLSATAFASSEEVPSDQCGVYLAESSSDHVLGSYAAALKLIAPLLSATAFASSEEVPSDQCGVYLAESSSDHVLGSYAGKNFQRDDVIGSHDAIIQFVDIRHNNALASEDEGSQLEGFLSFCWSGDATGGMNEGDEVISAVGGPCFTSTGHVGMINAIIYQPSTLLRMDSDLISSGYDETTSPGRGAFTTYHNLTLLAVDKIPAGMEIFLDFGSEYSQYDDPNKPNIDDYRKMDEAMEKMVTFFNKHAESMGEEAANEVYEFMKKDVLDLTAERRAPAARMLLPGSFHGLQAIIDKGGSALHEHPEVIKDVDWLRKNAYCQDNLVAGVSKIEHAGRGAFAARDIKKGEVVAPMPLVALNRGKDALTVFEDEDDQDDEEEEEEDENEERVEHHKQLLMNYMLEHPQSSVLFLPAGPVTLFVNHGGNDANVKLGWSTKSWSKVEAAHKIDPSELSEVQGIDMMLELIATRDIKKGEEVLLNYGKGWEEAWDDHVKGWKDGVKDSKLSKSSMTLNDIHHGTPIKPFPTSSEAEAEDKLKGVVLMCHLLYDEDKIERRRNQDGTRTKVYPWMPHPADGEKRLKTDVAVRGTNRKPCSILERSGDEVSGYKYLVRPDNREEGPSVLVKNVPHFAIRYVDEPYTNPQHEKTAFRHTIEFPDEIFPNMWKDLASGPNDEL